MRHTIHQLFMNHQFLLILIVYFFVSSCQSDQPLPIVAKQEIDGQWTVLTSKDQSKPLERHEAAFVKVKEQLLLLGGRGIKPVSIYNITEQRWTEGAKSPIELHHFQPVVFKDKVYIIGALTGPYPNETPVEYIYIYDPKLDHWEKGAAIPKNRLRGSTGVVLHKDKIYMVGGIKNGHIGDHKKWFDLYDPSTDTWKILEDAPRPRDHFQAVAKDGKLYLIAGRLSKAPDEVFLHPVKEVDIYDIEQKKWTTSKNDLPTLRAGNLATSYEEEILILGGESANQIMAHSEVEGFHTKDHTWRSYPKLISGRHGTGVVHIGKNMVIASGCGNRGGEPELSSVEVYQPKGSSLAPLLAYSPATTVSIDSTQFKINGQLTYKDRYWEEHKIEGLLFNARMVQGIFDDSNQATRSKWRYPKNRHFSPYRNTREFLAAMPSWKNHGLLAFSLNMQGGSPMGYGNKDWINTAYDSLGNIKEDYLLRLDMILQKADELEMVVILGLFYFGQDQHLKDEAAVINAVDNTINWLHQKRYRNVLIEINNECDSRNYDHDILREDRVHELMENVKFNVQNDYRYLVSTSFEGYVVPTNEIVKRADFVLLHGNGVNEPFKIRDMVDAVKNLEGYTPMPILFNEDDHYAFDRPKNNCRVAIEAYASWGYFDYRRKGESFANGFQSVPVDWTIGSRRKKDFFNYIKAITQEELSIEH